MAIYDNSNWRNNIITQLHERNRTQTQCFQDLVTQHNKLFDSANSLRSENLQLSVQNERLRTTSLSEFGSGNAGDSRLLERIQHLEQKLLAQQEELTELHRRKGENAQQIIDLNAKVQDKDKLMNAKEESLSECLKKIKKLEAEERMYQNNIKELEKLNQILRDEHQALQIAFASLEDKLRKAQEENHHLVDRLIRYKSKDAEKMNEENDKFLMRRNAKMQKELEEACRDNARVLPEDLREGAGPSSKSLLPTKAQIVFDAHEEEINAVKWSPNEKLLATGGADRRVKLWELNKGLIENRGVLMGSNAGVTSVDFDVCGTLILGASNDYASRIWSTSDHRLKFTLTGHCDKVLSAKFFGDCTKVITGSYDRTLKIWDLKSRGTCVDTKHATSRCTDIVTLDGSATTIISAHFDKKIRFWDSRVECNREYILLNGKITSLDLSRDSIYLLACVRDDTLKVIDLRMNEPVHSFSSDGFKVGCDWTRASFSPDAQYVSAGSSDGGIYIWGMNTAKLETILKKHTSSVTATTWHPNGCYLVSVDRTKKAVVWGN